MTYCLIEEGKMGVVHTHRVIIEAIFKVSEGNKEEKINEIRKFIKEKIGEWKKVSLEFLKLTLNPPESGNVIEAKVIVYTSEPVYYLPRIIPILIRSPEVVEREIYLYLSFLDQEIKKGLPGGFEIKIKRENVKAEQILFPEKESKKYVIRF
ncbi:MAG: hypothetical protein U9N04_04780 [Patescibacteria group bacterium]|nr:hypothetical protein [Patescibacteria group bacterium]